MPVRKPERMSTNRTLLACILLAFAPFGIAMAGPLDDASDAAGRGDHAATMHILLPLAEQGDAVAQNTTGVMYDTVRGVPQDYARPQMR
jgi:hypothetical protein